MSDASAAASSLGTPAGRALALCPATWNAFLDRGADRLQARRRGLTDRHDHLARPERLGRELRAVEHEVGQRLEQHAVLGAGGLRSLRRLPTTVGRARASSPPPASCARVGKPPPPRPRSPACSTCSIRPVCPRRRPRTRRLERVGRVPRGAARGLSRPSDGLPRKMRGRVPSGCVAAGCSATCSGQRRAAACRGALIGLSCRAGALAGMGGAGPTACPSVAPIQIPAGRRAAR